MGSLLSALNTSYIGPWFGRMVFFEKSLLTHGLHHQKVFTCRCPVLRSNISKDCCYSLLLQLMEGTLAMTGWVCGQCSVWKCWHKSLVSLRTDILSFLTRLWTSARPKTCIWREVIFNCVLETLDRSSVQRAQVKLQVILPKFTEILDICQFENSSNGTSRG